MTIRERILLVDDEPDLRELVAFNLEDAGFAVEAVARGQEGITSALAERPAVVILDLMLPDVSGTEVCRRMRSESSLSDVPILMLTARGDEYDRVLGFEVGADDYVVKPFSVRELVLRVRALSRRNTERIAARTREGGAGASAESDRASRLAWKGLEVDVARHRVYVDGEELSLRPLEFKLISVLLENPTRVFSRSQLLEEVWGTSGDIHTRTVDTHVRRLRERLGVYGEAVETVHSIGYRLRSLRD